MVCLLGIVQAVGAAIRARPMATCLLGCQSFSQAPWRCLEGVPVETLGGKEARKFKLLVVQFETLREVMR